MRSVVAVAVCAVLLVAGCGSSDDQELASVPGTNGTTPAATAPAATAPEVATTAGTPAPGASAGSAGNSFSDPAGKYRINVGRKWKAASGGSTKGQAWTVGAEQGGITPTLGMTTQDLPAAAQGMTPKEYMDLNIKDLKRTGFTVIKKGFISGVNTDVLGAIEYSGTISADAPEMHFLAIFDMSQSTVAIATLVTPPKSYEKYRSALLPYMRTLKVTA